MEMKVIFSQRLCALRKAKGKEYTRQKVANDLNISRASLEYYEKGQRLPDVEIAAKIANYYKVSVDYLLGKSDSQSNDKELKDVAECLGISDYAALAIQQLSGKISAEEAQKWVDENNYNADLVNGYNSSQADICNWIIANLFWEIQYTIGAALTQMYRIEKYNEPLEHSALGCSLSGYSDFVHLLINALSDKCKYRIDKLIVECSENAKNKQSKYYSIYNNSFLFQKYNFLSIDELEKFKKQEEEYNSQFPF